jgi:transcription termination/antitermination protein NusA
MSSSNAHFLFLTNCNRINIKKHLISMSTTNDFIAAIYQIADDRGLDQEKVLDQVKKAILTAYKKMIKDEVSNEEELTSHYVEMDNETGKPIILADKKVVSVVTDPASQILESQAKLIDSRLREGDHIQIDVTPENFGRIAAQAAMQRLMQGLRDAEIDTVADKYRDKVGKIISGIVQRKDPNYVRVEVERAEAVLPNTEQIPGEFYRSSERRRFLLMRLANTATDRRMVLSRSSIDFLKALFEVEVPEVATANVEIVNIAREPGSRSKVAVRSTHEKVDAIGACVGPRGTRIDTIMNEITPEKVDIILWDKDIQTFIINSLSPAKVVSISVDKKEAYAKVLVNEDMLSLAIGKDGQNVRLAAKLTGYKIDITSDHSSFEKPGKLGSEVHVEAPEAKADVVETEEVAAVEVTEEKPVKAKKTTKKDASESAEVTFETLEFTDRQKKLLEENSINSIDQLKQIVDGSLEVTGFTKRDLDKVKSLLGL